MKPKVVKNRNYVAKYSVEFCKSKTYSDRKRKLKTGYVKHKGIEVDQ